MTDEYTEMCDNLRIAIMAFNAGSYDIAYEMLEKLVYYVVSEKAKSSVGEEAIRKMYEDVKNAVANFSTCKDEAYWEMATELWDVLKNRNE